MFKRIFVNALSVLEIDEGEAAKRKNKGFCLSCQMG
jgi:hypothetical protein